MSSSVDSSVVLLKAQADWPRWLAVIRTKASHNEVWDHIKPTLNDGEVRRELRKPTPPMVEAVGKHSQGHQGAQTARSRRDSSHQSFSTGCREDLTSIR